MTHKILVVDDDAALLELIQYNLESSGFQTITASDGQAGLRSFFENRPDLVILDIAMPKMDGYQVCERIREMSDIPVILLTALGRQEDIIKGLDIGADDYMTKPFRVGELLARVKATLRRSATDKVSTDSVTYSDNYLTVDLESHRVLVEGNLVKLTPTEYKLLALLIRNKGRLLEFRPILEQVWGFEYIDDLDYLRVYIWHLRKKIEPDPKNPIYFLNELNTGYRFEPQN
ncbi:MAG: response regulator transcription factor [Anaerolineae bacterium]